MEGNDSILLELTQKMKLKKNNRYFTRTIPPDAILCALLLQPLKLCTKIRTTSNRIRKIAIMLIARNCLVRIPRHVLGISLAVESLVRILVYFCNITINEFYSSAFSSREAFEGIF